MLQCPHKPLGQLSAIEWVQEPVRRRAPPVAENNFILVVGGADPQQRHPRNLPTLICYYGSFSVCGHKTEQVVTESHRL